MSDLHPCEYCGTMLDENDEVESNIAVCGPRMSHYASQCVIYVHAAKESYRTEVVKLQAEVMRLRAGIAAVHNETDAIAVYEALDAHVRSVKRMAHDVLKGNDVSRQKAV